ncbi:MAG: ABC transporter substrate-binding protein, partial [Bacteroidota bacterium]
MRTKRITGIVVLATVLVGLAVLACWWTQSRMEEDGRLRVVFKRNANYLIYFVAKERGFLKDAGFDVAESELESTNLMIQALSTGQADFNPSTSVPALYAAEQNSPGNFKFLYITLMERGKANDAIIVRADSPYRELTDLKGRPIASPPGATSVILLKLIFGSVGVSLDTDRSVREMEPRTQLQALAAGQVDAVFAIEPVITLGSEKGISRVLDNESMENHIMNPIPIAGGVVSKRFLSERPNVTKRLRAAMERAIDFIRSNEAESRAILGRSIGMPEGTAKRLGINTYWKLQEVNPDSVQRSSCSTWEKAYP